MGDSIHVNEVALPEGVAVKTEGSLAVATVVVPKAVEEEVPEGAEEEIAEGEAAPEGEAPPTDAAPEGGGDS